ncbi:MAG: UvrD-helicase domain-containing protein [Leptolyngbya sp. SIO1E4]|nr:UvrD-helicase domain-containing protein [Leptolyngbya sp. SIO1E4]
MEFRISDTFTDSLTKLTSQEQKAVKTTAFDLQLNPASSGLRFHKLDRVKDPNFWSVSVNMDIRIIVHRTAASLMLCYVDHHDNAYNWAQKRKIERHPRTGAAQLVEVRETIEEVIIQQPVMVPTAAPTQCRPFADIPDDDLLAYGIPQEWLEDVQQATEDTLFDVAVHLPQEAAEALLELATGGIPQKPASIPNDTDPFSHPDAQRRFRIMSNVEELERALEYPWEKWTVFLHPGQRSLVERNCSGPTRVSGSAGTGKTIVGLHRAVHLARSYPNATILLTTFSPALANALAIKLDRLVGNQPAVMSRIQVKAIHEVVRELYTNIFDSPPVLVDLDEVRSRLLTRAADFPDRKFSDAFLWSEWAEVVDAWQLTTWDAYRDVPRIGRRTRLGSKQRELLWQVFQDIHSWLDDSQQLTWPAVFRQVTDHLTTTGDYPYTFAVIDEAQDMGIPELKFFGAIGTQRPDSLFFTGDSGQRIFQQPFSWKALGVDIRGRSQTLKINYRTSHQIRSSADRLLPSTIADVDGNQEDRRNTISVFNGPTPVVEVYDSPEAEIGAIGEWITNRLTAGFQPEEIGVFVRDQAQLERAIAAIQHAEATPIELDEHIAFKPGCIAYSTMHLAKGLEFRAVVVMACDDEVIPQQERIESVTDEASLEEVYTTERHLLYVACTRARDHLLISGIDPASEFLDDL